MSISTLQKKDLRKSNYFKLLDYKDMQVDHVKSVFYYNGTNDIDNLLPSCRMCNFYKSTFTLDEFRKNLESLHERLQKPFIYRLALKYGLITEQKKDVVFYFEKEQNND